MLYFCTLFDSNYLSRGLAMYESLKKQTLDFHLYIFAFDQASYESLVKIGLSNVSLISLKEFEDEKLLNVKPVRSIAEYCWTCTPSTVYYVLNNYNVEHCTYIDADLYFYSNPNILINEMQEKSVSIIAHRFSKKYSNAVENGIYCVQFMTFKNTESGLEVLKWWRNACLDWCYAKNEGGRYGDQKYLDDWPERFSSVLELKNLGGGVAPWNVQQYEVLTKNGEYLIKEKSTGNIFKLIFYHFHGLRFYENNKFILTVDYYLSKNVVTHIYIPHIIHLIKIKNHLNNVFSINKSNEFYVIKPFWKKIFKGVIWRLKGTYNVFNKNKLLK